MIAIGIDVWKSKRTVAILDTHGTVLAMPFAVQPAHFLGDKNQGPVAD